MPETSKDLSLTSHLLTIPPYSAGSSARLQSLYSDFSRQKLSNTAGFSANISWWETTLSSIVSAGLQPGDGGKDVLVLRVGNDLVEGLRWEKVGRPAGLGTVITELNDSRSLIPLSAFLSAAQSIYTTNSLAYRVASYVIGRPLWWLLEQANIVGGDNSGSEKDKWREVQGTHVIISLVERAAEGIISHQRSKPKMSLSESLYSISSFRSEFANSALPGVGLSDTDIKVLITYLQRDKKVLVSEKEVIKFVDEDDIDVAVTEVDHGVLEMKTTLQRLQEQIDEIQRKIEERVLKAKEHLHKRQKDIAMSYLRSKKQLEDLLVKRHGSLETIQTVLLKIESAAGDIEIMKAYETSTSTLKTLLAHPSLQRDHIDNTMESMAEALADHAEIDQAVRIGGEAAAQAADVGIDEDELAAELEELVREEKERTEKEERERELARERERERERERRAAIEEERRRAAALASNSVPPSVPAFDSKLGVDIDESKESSERAEAEEPEAVFNE